MFGYEIRITKYEYNTHPLFWGFFEGYVEQGEECWEPRLFKSTLSATNWCSYNIGLPPTYRMNHKLSLWGGRESLLCGKTFSGLIWEGKVGVRNCSWFCCGEGGGVEKVSSLSLLSISGAGWIIGGCCGWTNCCGWGCLEKFFLENATGSEFNPKTA